MGKCQLMGKKKKSNPGLWQCGREVGLQKILIFYHTVISFVTSALFCALLSGHHCPWHHFIEKSWLTEPPLNWKPYVAAITLICSSPKTCISLGCVWLESSTTDAKTWHTHFVFCFQELLTVSSLWPPLCTVHIVMFSIWFRIVWWWAAQRCSD